MQTGFAKHLAIVATLAGLWSCAVALADPGSGLVGHWTLRGDCRDRSGRNNHGVNHGVKLDGGDGAEFNGIDSYIEVPHAPALSLGTRPFSIAVWVHTEARLDDVPGDILGKYDPASRTGLTLGVVNHAGATSSQANCRNLSFGIDAARIDCEWTDCGRPGNSRHVCSLAVYDGSLYAGTLEAGRDEAGHVYRYDRGAKWTWPMVANGVRS